MQAKKSLGQHFLTDPNIIRKIADSVSPKPGGRIIEIGPGTGAVTDVLLQRYPQLEVIEVDPRAVNLLREKHPQLTIHHTDILKVDWRQGLAASASAEPSADNRISLIGNLPYYITSPILFSVLDNRELFHEAVFMIQKEVAERLVARHRTKEYGILSVQTQLLARVEYLFTVSRHVFHPKPNVESAVIKLHFDGPAPEVDLANLKTVVRTAFGQRRKTMSNSLKPILVQAFPDESLRAEAVSRLGLHRRAEELVPEEFIELTLSLYPSGR